MPFLRFFRFFFFALLLSAAVLPARAQLNAQEQKVADLMARASGQQRSSVTVDPILSRVARARAMDLAKRGYFSHVNPDGKGPNYLVRQAGYQLPSSYSQAASGNNIESIAAGDPTASGSWSLWMGSPSHKKHLLAQESFYTEQTSIGVGYYADAGSDYRHYWVVISAPPAGPTLAIASPLAGAGLTAEQVTVKGTCGGAPAAARMVVRLENANGIGEMINASGTSSWSATVSGLVAGSNTIRVRSLDANGNTIKELTRTFRRVVLQPLVVSIVGNGTVSKGFENTTPRELAAAYKIAASPAPGWIFDRWSGSVDRSSAILSFVMAEGFQLTAHFRVNPFYALQNSYTGLVQTGTPVHDSSGLLKVRTTAAGTFSGRLTLGGRAYAVSGRFDSAGDALVTIKRGARSPLRIALHLDLAGGSGLLTGSVTDGNFTADLSADPATPPRDKHPAAGRYTAALSPNPEDLGIEHPQGTGVGILVVNNAGVASFSGTLANGTAFSTTANLTAAGLMPVYIPLFAGSGSLTGTLSIDPQTGTVTGSVLWTKPERSRDAVFPGAFVTTLGIDGSSYTTPVAGNTALEVTARLNNSALQLTGGNLAARVQQMATVLPTHRVEISDPQLAKLTLKINAANGRLSGSFTHPLTGATSKILGVILQDRNLATGFFLGNSQSGRASLTPAN